MAKRSLSKRLGYGFLHVTCRIMAVVFFRIRCVGRDYVPGEGGALVLSSHQSYLDPVLMGLACDRRLNYLARKSLFRFLPFRWLIQFLDAIPIEREGSGFGGLKETLRRLKQGEMVLLFPEGTRTPDGLLAPIKPGFCAVARRAKVPLVPVAIVGAFEAWPRSQPLPGPSVICIHFGPPIEPDQIAASTDEEIVAEVERRLHVANEAALEHRRRIKSDGFERSGTVVEAA